MTKGKQIESGPEASGHEASAQATAFAGLRDQLLGIPADRIVEPKVVMSLVLAQARELIEILSQASVRERLRSVGVPEAKFEQLQNAALVVSHAEQAWVETRDQQKSPGEARAEAQAYALRDEMVAACRYHLDGVEVLEVLARVTDGESPHDLVQDLRELAAFVRSNVTAFKSDTSFDPEQRAEEAVELADAVRLDCPVADSGLKILDLRDRAFTHLYELLEELRQAGRYAYRGTTWARRYFAADVDLARRRHALSSSVRALAV